MMANGTSQKCKEIVLLIEEEVKIIELLNKFVSYSVIMVKFGIGKSMVSDFNKNREKILSFTCEVVDMGIK